MFNNLERIMESGMTPPVADGETMNLCEATTYLAEQRHEMLLEGSFDPKGFVSKVLSTLKKFFMDLYYKGVKLIKNSGMKKSLDSIKQSHDKIKSYIEEHGDDTIPVRTIFVWDRKTQKMMKDTPITDLAIKFDDSMFEGLEELLAENGPDTSWIDMKKSEMDVAVKVIKAPKYSVGPKTVDVRLAEIDLGGVIQTIENGMEMLDKGFKKYQAESEENIRKGVPTDNLTSQQTDNINRWVNANMHRASQTFTFTVAMAQALCGLGAKLEKLTESNDK